MLAPSLRIIVIRSISKKSVRRTGYGVLVDDVLASAITVVVVDRNNGPVDGELLKVGATVTVDLGIKIRVDAALKERILGEVDPTNNMTGLELKRCQQIKNSSGCNTRHILTMACSTSAK